MRTLRHLFTVSSKGRVFLWRVYTGHGRQMSTAMMPQGAKRFPARTRPHYRPGKSPAMKRPFQATAERCRGERGRYRNGWSMVEPFPLAHRDGPRLAVAYAPPHLGVCSILTTVFAARCRTRYPTRRRPPGREVLPVMMAGTDGT